MGVLLWFINQVITGGAHPVWSGVDFLFFSWAIEHLRAPRYNFIGSAPLVERDEVVESEVETG